MAQVDAELIYEILKKIQAGVAHLNERVENVVQQIISLRDQVHSLQGDVFRIERQNAAFSLRFDRIEKRLDLATA